MEFKYQNTKQEAVRGDLLRDKDLPFFLELRKQVHASGKKMAKKVKQLPSCQYLNVIFPLKITHPIINKRYQIISIPKKKL